MTTNCPSKCLEMCVSATLESVDRACSRLRGFLAALDLEPRFFEVSLVAREALVNAVVHGCAEERARQIRFRVEIRDREIVTEIEDPGPGFHWQGQVNRTAGLDDIHGRGLSIFDAYCKHYEYNRAGNKVRLYQSVAG